jgi:hypothetical protein
LNVNTIVHEIDDVAHKIDIYKILHQLFGYVYLHIVVFFFCETFAEKTQSKCGQWKCSKHGLQLCEQLLLHILWEMCFIKQKRHWRPQQQQASSKICEVTRKYTSTQALLHR